ncbi:ABC transporter ATP-binding protein [Trueperella pyogenes]|uniref:ABC transporter ATP-binding protein n=1 Tax=Trueperella pyogenes TaxID=1661 RepID=A0A3Q9GKD1_9ACTO|nr:ABC transporter ATP-binding protein [Trueperella pyogenes]AJC68898.1 ABC transporter ATPase [Trueperella pyogenes TP8]ALD73590.1 histidinol phosphatase [Trueperella pyogenes]AWG03838.1 ABC transporter ATP-binding protein [Trueperella pyogenes]AWG16568.1 ABC transporter ATP-binding protein [Trueperella pyogenes]AZR05447.1 ABC transporter ATP-binding protein [Trueperella pyogenes]
MIEIKDVEFKYGDRLVIDNITVTASSGRILGLIGPNGAGKSTLLSLIYRLLTPQHGNVVVDGSDIRALSRNEVAQRMAVVAQHNEATMPLTVFDCVALGRLGKSTIFNYCNDADNELVRQAINYVGLAGYERRLSSELSGGEWQRALIARAIVQQSTHLLLDEPTNHLDIHHQYAVLQLMRELSSTTVVVLHDLNLAAQFCDDLALLQNGKIVASGTPEEVLTAERISEVYQIHAEVVTQGPYRHLVYSPYNK